MGVQPWICGGSLSMLNEHICEQAGLLNMLCCRSHSPTFFSVSFHGRCNPPHTHLPKPRRIGQNPKSFTTSSRTHLPGVVCPPCFVKPLLGLPRDCRVQSPPPHHNQNQTICCTGRSLRAKQLVLPMDRVLVLTVCFDRYRCEVVLLRRRGFLEKAVRKVCVMD